VVGGVRKVAKGLVLSMEKRRFAAEEVVGMLILPVVLFTGRYE
jgi:hypothetical protein